jgi:hypothetical protein
MRVLMATTGSEGVGGNLLRSGFPRVDAAKGVPCAGADDVVVKEKRPYVDEFRTALLELAA